MASDTEQTDLRSGAAVELPPKLDTSAAAALHDVLMGHAGADVTLDGRAVEQVGGRCLDLLMTARSVWSDAGHTLHLHTPSDAMLRDFATFGADIDMFAKGDAQ